MVLRFNDTGNLQQAVTDGWLANPQYAFTVKQHIYLLENGDLYIDDDFDPNLTGMFLMRLRIHNYLEENADMGNRQHLSTQVNACQRIPAKCRI